MKKILVLLLFFALSINSIFAEDEEKDEKKEKMSSSTFSGLKFRGIGPALTSGRIIDFAVNPEDKNTFMVAVASGGVWKTTDKGITFKPVFDSEGSYSIGCVTYAQSNPHIVWVGSGENNSQRSVSYGDGVYKSTDGGNSWKNMGLKNSEHIGKIIVHPKNCNIVYVAAQGPLWNAGGDRGLYKTEDGGETWNKVLDISENTGISDIVMDPRNPDVIYASSYQRRRHVWTLINGGPEAAVHKTADGGKTWNKLSKGLPGGELGRIGLAISPVNPDVVYALIEASGDKGGFFRSTDRGGSWEKRYNYKSVSAQYYQEIFCDPKDVDKIYAIDTYTKVSEDGGKTWSNLGNKHRHVDDHALWIDPCNTDYLLIGGDGGIYESYDGGSTWRFFENLPVIQFYRVGIDNAEPFYNVYGGTQDNNTYGGPSQTMSSQGISNEDWFKVVGGDGFQARVDPNDPNIVYAQPQYGFLVRYDRKSGNMQIIKPEPAKDEELRFNWDSPLIISPHSPTRLYFAANKLFRSEDRGDSWEKISPDLTRQINRNELEIMGKVWDPEAVAKNASTSLYGNIVSLTESPLQEDLLYVGTDDGLIQITEDAGKNWTKVSTFPTVPETTYVSDLFASQHNANTVYAAFDNHKMGDFKPYILKSTDKGKSWTSISANLPENGPVCTIVEDHVNPDLLFAGTEFGVFFTVDGGKKWIQMKSGIPTIAVKDIEIQKRENDLVLATFGRGFYILDNYAPLRTADEKLLENDYHMFDIKDALMFNFDNSKVRGHMGETYFRAPNPEYGATFTYYVKEAPKTLKQLRKEKEKEATKDKKKKDKKNKEKYQYPTFEELRKEDLEASSYLIFSIDDEFGNHIRNLTAPVSPGINRMTWDLNFAAPEAVDKNSKINKHSGTRVLPGTYSVTVYLYKDNEVKKILEPKSFNVKYYYNVTLPAKDRKALVDFQMKSYKLYSAVNAANKIVKRLDDKVSIFNNTVLVTPGAPVEMVTELRQLELQLEEIKRKLNGDNSISSRNGNQPPSISDRITYVMWGISGTASAPTKTQIDSYNLASEEFTPVLAEIKQINDVKIIEIEKKLDELGSPWTPGRFPELQSK